jgi:general secretion pathway protein K
MRYTRTGFKKWKNNQGVALLITLSIIVILVTVGLQLNKKTRATVDAAAAQKDRFTLTQMATGAVNVAMAMLIKDAIETKVDSVQEDWADPKKIEEMLEEIPFDDGKVSIVISDELSRIQVNALVDFPEGMKFNTTQQTLWQRFLENLFKLYKETEDINEMEDINETEDTNPDAIINSIKDWLDSKDDDAVTGLSGAESDYYMGLEPPYKCKNGPFSHLGEVALVKGIPPELFNGSKELLGLSSYLTVYGAVSNTSPPTGDSNTGDIGSSKKTVQTKEGNFTYEGQININTADLPVLMALLPSEAADFAKNLYDFRILKADEDTYVNDLNNPDWYKNVPGFTTMPIEDSLLTVKSDFFRITATASRHKTKLTVSAVIQREKNEKSGKWECKILNWQTE